MEENTHTEQTDASNAGGARVTMLGHSTLLLEMNGKRVLTDPWLTEPIYFGALVHGVPVPAPAEVFPVDLIIISHGHADHCDPATLKAYPPTVPVIVLKGCEKIVSRLGYREVFPVLAGDKVDINGVVVEALPGKHVGGVVPYMLHGEAKIYFGADSVACEELSNATRGSRPDAAILPISGGRVGAIRAHMGPVEAAELASTMEARVAIPSHYHFAYKQAYLQRFSTMLLRPDCLNEFRQAMKIQAPAAEVCVLDVLETWENRG